MSIKLLQKIYIYYSLEDKNCYTSFVSIEFYEMSNFILAMGLFSQQLRANSCMDIYQLIGNDKRHTNR